MTKEQHHIGSSYQRYMEYRRSEAVPVEEELPYELLGLLGGAMNSEMGMLITQLTVDQGAETIEDVRDYLGWQEHSDDQYQARRYEAIRRAYDRLVSANLVAKIPGKSRYHGNSYVSTPLGRNIGIIFAGRGLQYHSGHDIAARDLYGSSTMNGAYRSLSYVDTPYGTAKYELNHAEIRARLIHQLAIGHKNKTLPIPISGLIDIPLVSAEGIRNNLTALQDIDLATLSVLDPSAPYAAYDIESLAKWQSRPEHASEKLALSNSACDFIVDQILSGNLRVSPAAAAEAIFSSGGYKGDPEQLRKSLNLIFRHFAQQNFLAPTPQLKHRDSTVTLEGSQAVKINELVTNFRHVQIGDSGARPAGAAVLKNKNLSAVIKAKIEKSLLRPDSGNSKNGQVSLYEPVV